MVHRFGPLFRIPKGPMQRNYTKPTDSLTCGECEHGKRLGPRRIFCGMFPGTKRRRPEWVCIDEAERVKREQFAREEATTGDATG